MSEVAIEIEALGKMYKLYRRPVDKVLDAIGVNRWLFWRKNYYQEFWALRDLNLRVMKGERLGIVGRNGAGKSTLLKIISGNIAASEGNVSVKGSVQALMELGTGFHPEFTGYENIRASLAYQGFSAAQIREKEEEIVDFAELEGFIDQPVKTYSSGMYARLAFSAATAVEPEILIIDEILGAGDAYFAGKCVERMRRLTEGCGATVLFVSHDLGSVQQMCNRAVWINRGRLIADGTPLDITKAYYASVLRDEEIRLKAQAVRLQRQSGKPSSTNAEIYHQLIGRLASRIGSPLNQSHPIRRLSLNNQNGFSLTLEPGSPMDNDVSQLTYLYCERNDQANWSEPRTYRDSRVRYFQNADGPDCYASFVFTVPALDWKEGTFRLEIEHAAQCGEAVEVEVFEDGSYREVGRLSPSRDGWWTTDSFLVTGEALTASASPYKNNEDACGVGDGETNARDDIILVQTQDRWESVEAAFREIVPIDESGRENYIFSCGQPFAFRVSVRVRTPLPRCWLDMVIYNSWGNRVVFWIHELADGIPAGEMTWQLKTNSPNLRQGEYICSFELLERYDELATEKLPYYCHWNRCVAIKIDEKYTGHIPLGVIRVPFELKELSEHDVR